MPGNGRPKYRVSYTGLVQLALHALGQRANGLGMGDDFVSVLRHVDEKLHSDPSSLGEALFSLAAAGLSVRAYATPFFYVRFAVDEVRFIVHVTRCDASSRLD